MVEDKSEIQIIEESWQDVVSMSKDKMSLLQISFEIGVNYDTLKKHASKIALEQKVLDGSITAIQLQKNLTDASEFEEIKKQVWGI